jgi:hypothetical protein
LQDWGARSFENGCGSPLLLTGERNHIDPDFGLVVHNAGGWVSCICNCNSTVWVCVPQSLDRPWVIRDDSIHDHPEPNATLTIDIS